jgi:gluconolactonase
MERRTFLAGAAAAAAVSSAKPAEADRLPFGDLPNWRYPDPRVDVLDKRFTAKVGNAAIERIATGFRWAEGPVYLRDYRCLIWSDIPNNRLMRWNEEDGHYSVFRQPSNYTYGNTRDRQGRLLSCEHHARRVVRTEHDGTITVLIDCYDGKKLNAPNDVASDDSIWFTDPGYGILMWYEGHKDTLEQAPRVYRIDGKTGKASIVSDSFDKPNGIAFAPDEKKLYIIDTGITHGGGSNMRVLDVDVATGKTTADKVFAENFAPGFTDGVRTDIDGNVWCSMGWAVPKEDGVRIYAPTGDLIGKIHIPETCANLCFGGSKRNRLFICGSTSVYTTYVETQGALLP